MRVAIVGCGLIGNKRAEALHGGATLVAAVDTSIERANALPTGHAGCPPVADWRDVMAREDIDAVIVATTNDQLAPITRAAMESGKHVLVEKPAARNAAELEPLVL